MANSVPNFIEADFRKSSFSDPNMDCVHVARRGNWVALRDSKTHFTADHDRRLILADERFDVFLAQYRR